ncbi:MAG TPA: extracellular solute-binding protein [Symbiobacteriaceae bacterium]|nr:extracellular solute-binding protein [Symbiobacteriaceae bacterium]
MTRLHRSSATALTAVLLAGLALTGCAGRTEPTKAPAPATETAKKPFEGVTLRFLGAQHPWFDTLKKEIPAFEAETGMKVNTEVLAEGNLTQKLTVELTAGTGTIDVFMQRPLQEAKQFEKNGWYADLNPFLKDAKKTKSDYDFNDFFQGTREVETLNGHVVGVPIVTEQQIVYYRKDLFAAKNVKVPTTMAELEAAAKALNDPKSDFYGIVMRGQGNPAVTQYSSFLYSMGGDFVKDGKFVIDSPEALKAFQIYGDLLGKYGPPGVLNMHWQQASGLFAQGKAAMWVDANSLYLNVADPAKSTVSDKVGYAMFPAGDKGALPYSVTSWGLSIAKSSKQQDAAWAFVQWATSKAITTKTQAAGNPSARTSVWANADANKGWPAEWVTVAKKSGEAGKSTDRPLVINVGKARDLIGEVITAAINGKDLAATAKDRNVKLNALLADENK